LLPPNDGIGANVAPVPCGFWKAVDRRSASVRQPDAGELPEESTMTRFQRVLLLSAGCGVIALGIAYLIIVLLG
jgi:hypothetical protein